MAKQNLGGVYANMDFPPYVWQEYPKYVITGPHGEHKIAQSAAEEQEIRAKLQKEQDDAPPEPVFHVADPAKEILISRARELGVPFNSKWSKAKLEQTVKDAEDSVDSLPPEEGVKKAETTIQESFEEENLDPEESQDNQHALLLDEAKNLGVKGQGMPLWGIPRLKSAIAEAKAKR